MPIYKSPRKAWRENRGELILKYRNEIAPKIVEKMLKEEEEKLGKEDALIIKIEFERMLKILK